MSKFYEKILKEEINNLDDGIIEQLYKLYFLSFKNSDYYRNYNNVEWDKISPIITFSLKSEPTTISLILFFNKVCNKVLVI